MDAFNAQPAATVEARLCVLGSGSKAKSTALFVVEEPGGDESEEELPMDEAGRRTIKRQF